MSEPAQDKGSVATPDIYDAAVEELLARQAEGLLTAEVLCTCGHTYWWHTSGGVLSGCWGCGCAEFHA